MINLIPCKRAGKCRLRQLLCYRARDGTEGLCLEKQKNLYGSNITLHVALAGVTFEIRRDGSCGWVLGQSNKWGKGGHKGKLFRIH